MNEKKSTKDLRCQKYLHPVANLYQNIHYGYLYECLPNY